MAVNKLPWGSVMGWCRHHLLRFLTQYGTLRSLRCLGLCLCCSAPAAPTLTRGPATQAEVLHCPTYLPLCARRCRSWTWCRCTGGLGVQLASLVTNDARVSS